jgi:23S rRNA pseudouridine2457 synthase
MAKLVLLNKPFQVMSQFSAEGDSGKTTLADYVHIKGVYPAGRLDYDSEGLLLLTDNGLLQHEISHPDQKMPKTYFAQVEGIITNEALRALEEGVTLNDGPTKPAIAQHIEEPQLWERHPPIRHRENIPTSWLSLTIKEGRNRQVRRMTAAVGFPTLRLVRMSIGDWQIDGMQPGEYRVIDVPDPVATAKPKAGQFKGKRKSGSIARKFSR